MIEIGSKWTHAAGGTFEIMAAGEDSVEPNGCGTWAMDKFLAEWSLAENKPEAPANLVADHPSKDGTSDAHPAWHRGHEHGKRAAYEAAAEMLTTDAPEQEKYARMLRNMIIEQANEIERLRADK